VRCVLLPSAACRWGALAGAANRCESLLRAANRCYSLLLAAKRCNVTSNVTPINDRPAVIAQTDADMRELLARDDLPPATRGLIEQCRLLARALALASDANDFASMQKLNSELRQTRALLLNRTTGSDDTDADDRLQHDLDVIAAAIRDSTRIEAEKLRAAD